MDEFEDFGQILDINIRRRIGKSFCNGYVKMKNRSIAEQAIDGIQNKKYLLFFFFLIKKLFLFVLNGFNFKINRLGWKVSLYDRDNDDRRSRYSNHSRSRSNVIFLYILFFT